MRPNLEVSHIGIKSHGYRESDIVMSDLEDSMVTYTEDPYAYVEAALQAPPSPDYVPDLEHLPTLKFVLKPVYLKFMPPEDDVLLAKEQSLPAAVSPTADSPGYITESDPKEDPEEDAEDPEEDPADYPTERDDDDDYDYESSRNEADDEEENEDEDEDEEHPTPADSVPPPVHRVTARMSVRAQTPISLPLKTEFARVLAIPTLPPSPLSPWLRAESPSTSHPLPSSTLPSGTPPLLPIPLPTSSPHLLLPSTSHRVDVPEVTLPPQKRLCIALGLRFEVGESSSAPTARPTRGFRADYGFVGTLDDEIGETLRERRMTYFVTTIRRGTDEICGRLDDAQDDRLLMSRQLNMLRRDRLSHACIARLKESEARLSREAWVQSIDASDTACAEKMAPKKTTKSTPATKKTTTTIRMTNAQLKALIDQGVADALAACDTDRSQNGKDNHDSGTGVVELTQWFERMETVYHISNCIVENQIKFATCTLLESALTWWNSHVKTVGLNFAYPMTWTYLKKRMTEKYCPMREIKKLEVEL
nr:reverse transcriptase domain-containing protein [Tanacetum cinerariifolium]